MREIPECLNRRYQTLDKLIKDLSTRVPPAGSISERPSCESNQIGIKLMCDFWNILQDDPDCNLMQEVQQRMGIEDRDCSGMYGPPRVDCFVAGKDPEIERRRDAAMNRIKHICVTNESKCQSKRYGCGANPTDADKIPLSQVLCNLKEAASFDKKCNVRVGELISAQTELKEQIQVLEEREKQGVMLLKQADCMWSCMEDSYKKKVAESQERYALLVKELKEVEQSANKWRKNKKDLEFQLTNIKQCHEDIKEKINQKTNDLKLMDIEIEEFKKRVESNAKDLNAAKNSYKSKREASDARMATIAMEMTKVQKKLAAEYKFKADKEKEGTNYVKEAREDLQKICKVLLQKKLENEDLRAEKDALLQEIDLLKMTCDNCKEKCAKREKAIAEEMIRVEAELAEFRVKCIKCHECTDTIDARKFCTDCPRCLAERDCLYEDNHCSPDHTMDCVCMSVKQKFLDNVFDNMYTVLERQSKTCPGKAVADCILNCLKRSRNGKLNEETRKVLQDFILSTVKKNLNLTIVGGAVKTRCEMDPETYKQLMLCLKDVTVTRPVKEDKGTAARKEPCRRWGGPSECNCPKGPKACVCTKRAPPPPTDPTSCGPPQDDDKDPSTRTCPQRESLACGTDCGMQGVPGAAAWKREPCAGQTCPFSKNMRAAQCVLGPEALASVHLAPPAPPAYPARPAHPTPPILPGQSAMEKMATCTCGGKAVKPCPCHRDHRSEPRHHIIEEVMGRYTEVTPIENVPKVAEGQFGVLTSTRRIDSGCDCSNLPMKYLLATNISENKISRYCACSSNYVSREGRTPFLKKLRKKGHISICRNTKSNNDTNMIKTVQIEPDVGFKTPQSNTHLRDESDNDIKIILCPKFPYSCDDKIEISLGTSDMQTSESTNLRLEYKSSSKIDQQLNLCDASFVGRKVCETVKELMKDIVVPEMPPTNYLSSSEVEWVTLESLYKEISSLTKLEGLSRDTVNEVEVKCETLEASKDFRLLDKNINEVHSVSLYNNIIEIPQNITINENSSDYENNNFEISESIYSGEHNGKVAEELKLKLLDDIRLTYNISVETSLENVIEPDFNARKLKNIRKCLRDLGETSIERNECNCVKTQRQRHDAHKSSLKKTKNCFPYEKNEDDVEFKNYSGIREVKKCLVAISDMQRAKYEKSETKVKFQKEVKNKLDSLKRKKSKKLHKKNI